MLEDGITDALVQPTHLLYGIEYDKMRRQWTRMQGDLHPYSLAYRCWRRRRTSESWPPYWEPIRGKGEALVFWDIARSLANVVYPALQMIFFSRGREDVLMGRWRVGRRMSARSSMCPRPDGSLMLVAGDHAIHDMAGDRETAGSATLRRTDLQFNVSCKGWSYAPIQELYQKHIRHCEKETDIYETFSVSSSHRY
ncbi:MAG: hypothetical protein ACLTDS_03655 [Bianqueaceae bacterium]